MEPTLPRAAEKSNHLLDHPLPCIAPLRLRQLLKDKLKRLSDRDFDWI
jgi:hypothetical protein